MAEKNKFLDFTLLPPFLNGVNEVVNCFLMGEFITPPLSWREANPQHINWMNLEKMMEMLNNPNIIERSSSKPM